MSPNRHSISAISTAKKFKTPLKASVVLLTTMILAACNTTDDPLNRPVIVGDLIF